VKVAKEELTLECDYVYERRSQIRMAEYLRGDAAWNVPGVIDELCSQGVLTTEFAPGVAIDKAGRLSTTSIRTQFGECFTCGVHSHTCDRTHYMIANRPRDFSSSPSHTAQLCFFVHLKTVELSFSLTLLQGDAPAAGGA